MGQRVFGTNDGGRDVSIKATLNEVLVKLFRNINNIEEQAVKQSSFKDITVNDMHVMEAVGVSAPQNMSTVAKALMVTTGTLTISVNGLVKKGYVERVRSEEDRRVVLVSLTEKGKKAFRDHQRFHEEMVTAIIDKLSVEEQKVLEQALGNLSKFFYERVISNVSKSEGPQSSKNS